MAKKFVRNITHTNLRAKDEPNEPLYTNVQNDLLSDEHDAFIRNEDANQPDEHYVLLTGNVETDRVDSSDSDILSVEKHDKHGLTFHPKHVKIGSTDKKILDFTEDKPHEFKAHPKHTKITTKNDELKVSEDKPLEFEIDDTQVKTNRKKIADHETRIKKNSDDIATNKQAIADNKTAFDNLQIGGRNLLIGTSDTWDSGTNSGWGNFSSKKANINEPGMYTASVYLKPDKKSACIVIEVAKPDGTYHRYFGNPVTGGSKGYSTETIQLAEGQNLKAVWIAFRNSQKDATRVSWKRFKLEKGNKVTDWTPAPEDTDSKIAALQTDLAAITDRIKALEKSAK